MYILNDATLLLKVNFILNSFTCFISGLIQQAAQNVLLIDAVMRSAEEEFATHHDNKTLAASFLTYFTKCWSEGQGQLAEATKDVLQHCVDPNMREPQKYSIEALLYTTGKRDGLQYDEAHGPALWCGMYDCMSASW